MEKLFTKISFEERTIRELYFFSFLVCSDIFRLWKFQNFNTLMPHVFCQWRKPLPNSSLFLAETSSLMHFGLVSRRISGLMFRFWFCSAVFDTMIFFKKWLTLFNNKVLAWFRFDFHIHLHIQSKWTFFRALKSSIWCPTRLFSKTLIVLFISIVYNLRWMETIFL